MNTRRRLSLAVSNAARSHFESKDVIGVRVVNGKTSPLVIASLLLGGLTAGAPLNTALAQPGHGKWVEGRILVKPRAGFSRAGLEKAVKAAKGKDLRQIHSAGVHLVTVNAKAEEAVVRALSRNPNIDFAELDHLVELTSLTVDDEHYSDAWHLPKIGAPQAWELSQGDGVTIAIIDSGVDAAHPDLAGKLVAGWNAVTNTPDPSDTSDISGHGTMVAGVAAAGSNNSIGVTSIAWGASIMPVRVTNSEGGTATWSDIVRGLDWAAENGAQVANISYDVNGSLSIQYAAQRMRNSGGVVISAAGNYGADYGYADNPYVVTVSATTSTDTLASWSSYGNYIDVAAPGSGIWTTRRGGDYISTSGTSFASPAIAGVAALLFAANPSLTPDQAEQILFDSTDDLGGSGWDSYFGHGRVNAEAAVQMAMGTSPGVDGEPPTVDLFAPTDGSSVAGTVPVDVSASDNETVSEVALYVNGRLIGRDTTSPFRFSWDSGQEVDGPSTLRAYAYDATGNEGVSAEVGVTVENQSADTEPPVVDITAPRGGSVVSGGVTVELSAADNEAVTGVTLYADGRLVGTDATAPYQVSWDTTQDPTGPITLTAVAYDAAGNEGVSGDLTVDVDNQGGDTTPPSVGISSPSDGASIGTRVSVRAHASDAEGVTEIEVSVDGQRLCSTSSDSIRCKWNARKASSGAHTISVTGRDAAGNEATQSITVYR